MLKLSALPACSDGLIQVSGLWFQAWPVSALMLAVLDGLFSPHIFQLSKHTLKIE